MKTRLARSAMWHKATRSTRRYRQRHAATKNVFVAAAVAKESAGVIHNLAAGFVAEVETNCNTYGLHEFVSLGSDGFLDLDADVDDLIEDPESDDDMN